MENTPTEPLDDGFLLIDFGPIIDHDNQRSLTKAEQELGPSNPMLQYVLADHRYARADR